MCQTAMCQSANAPPRGGKKYRPVRTGDVVLVAVSLVLLALQLYIFLNPDSALAHRQKLLSIGHCIWLVESDLRELEEATRATADEMSRAGLEYENLVHDINALGPVRPDQPELQSKLAKLVTRRDELDRVFEVLEDRQQKLRQQIFHRRDQLDRHRAERARHLTAIHTQN